MKLISYLKAHKCLKKKCHAFFTHDIGTEQENRKVEDVLVVCEYPEVFPIGLPGVLPHLRSSLKLI